MATILVRSHRGLAHTGVLVVLRSRRRRASSSGDPIRVPEPLTALEPVELCGGQVSQQGLAAALVTHPGRPPAPCSRCSAGRKSSGARPGNPPLPPTRSLARRQSRRCWTRWPVRSSQTPSRGGSIGVIPAWCGRIGCGYGLASSCVCCRDRRTGCSRRGRAAASRELSVHP
jgi:hypothetical protein